MAVALESLSDQPNRDARASGMQVSRRTRRQAVAEGNPAREPARDLVSHLTDAMRAALFELLRGVQAAERVSQSPTLAPPDAAKLRELASGLPTLLMRLVFLLYAEQRNLLPADAGWSSQPLTQLFDRLQADAAEGHADLERRFELGRQLQVRFRQLATQFPPAEPLACPLSDASLYRVLRLLLVRDGQCMPLGSLAVEQLGSLYEGVLGFVVHQATGRSLAFRPAGPNRVPQTLDLDRLGALPPEQRRGWFRLQTGHTLAKQAAERLRAAAGLEQVLAAVEAKVAWQLTPQIVPAGGLILAASDERRGSGSHYTPRSLTEPIVRRTLEPLFRPGAASATTPEQILNLKICDPAMGSGAFLLETCRQLGEHLVHAWAVHGGPATEVAGTEPRLLAARRLVAQRCIYGVDKNPLAVELARLSLWLLTQSREPPWGFLEHALRWGDSLVGLTRRQLLAVDWKAGGEPELTPAGLAAQLARATEARLRAWELDGGDPRERRRRLAEADRELHPVRLIGDACLRTFFGNSRNAARERQRRRLRDELRNRSSYEAAQTNREPLIAAAHPLRQGAQPLPAFHWEIEFPEVFSRHGGGFDACVGNPPFAGKNTLACGHPPAYRAWLQTIHPGSHGNADLVAHFFRAAFRLLRNHGTLGFLATNTVSQGDTRATGLGWIRSHQGEIYEARRRVLWPGSAAVVASLVHLFKGAYRGPKRLDGRPVDTITAFLFHRGSDHEPQRLRGNSGKAFQGQIVLGMGFTFDDRDTKGVASPLAEMRRLIARDPRNAQRIFPYLGGEELHTSPNQAPHRFVIDLSDLSEEQARDAWPDLMRIVEQRVKPRRLGLPPKNNWNRDVAARWWQFASSRRELKSRIDGLPRVLVTNAQATPHLLFVFYRPNVVFANSLNVIASAAWSWFTCLQSRLHEVWARFFCSSMKDDLRYNPSACFRTFPFPPGVLETAAFPSTERLQPLTTDPRVRELERVGCEYYRVRARLMIRHDQGLTKTYNRFHNPQDTTEPIARLRQLHAALDRAVFRAYGWDDLADTAGCQFQPEGFGSHHGANDLTGNSSAPRDIGRRQPKPRWRLSWPDDLRDEVLARLLELNEKDARKEA